jgi:hypothetical protein
MPRGDKSGPSGEGPGTGRGMGSAQGSGRDWGGGFAAGPGGYCVCPNCGESVTHQVRTSCNSQRCPKCGMAMTRE